MVRNEREATDNMILMNQAGESIADCSPGNPYMTVIEAEANALLTAAGPDMLKALRAVRECEEDPWGAQFTGVETWALIDTALAKAEKDS